MSPTKEKKRKANSLRSLPGKILAVCICLLPFLTREIAVALPESVRSAYFYPAGQTSVNDFEQYCREIALLMIAAVFGIWTLAELLRPERRKAGPETGKALQPGGGYGTLKKGRIRKAGGMPFWSSRRRCRRRRWRRSAHRPKVLARRTQNMSGPCWSGRLWA